MNIAITIGEPAGIGPEISLIAARDYAAQAHKTRLILLGDARLLAQRARDLDIQIALHPYQRDTPHVPGSVEVLDCPFPVTALPGRLDPRNGRALLSMLDRAIAGALSGEFAAIVTAPLQKSTINAAGVAFTGHTEYFAEKTGTPRAVMLLAGGGMRVALVTTHMALKDVAAAISRPVLDETIAILNAELKRSFGIARPRIVVAGLNPHAGDGGYLGREEIDLIKPALEQARAAGVDVRGPFAADAVFQPKLLTTCDAVLAMYHDQGLPVLKFASFGRGVNITLGLPIIRTSVDHGTALDLAGTGRADWGSMRAAIDTAVSMAKAARASRAG